MANKKIELEQQNTCSRGFTLVEMSVVLVIISILLSAGLKVASSVLSTSASSSTTSNMNVIKQSLVSYLRSNGKLPCPDISASPTGISPALCTSSAQGYGVVPWVTLGLSRDIALDGFGNFITYRVSNTVGNAIPPGHPGIPSAYNAQQIWTDTTQANSFTILNIQNKTSPYGNKTIEIQGRDETTGAVYPITYNAIVVLFSHGKNGYGAKTVKGTTNIAPSGADEIVNNTNGSTTFITRKAVDSSSASGGEFDDVITYMTPNDLLQPLLSDLTLVGTCRAYCPTPACAQTSPPTCSPTPQSGCTPSNIPVGATPATCP